MFIKNMAEYFFHLYLIYNFFQIFSSNLYFKYKTVNQKKEACQPPLHCIFFICYMVVSLELKKIGMKNFQIFI